MINKNFYGPDKPCPFCGIDAQSCPKCGDHFFIIFYGEKLQFMLFSTECCCGATFYNEPDFDKNEGD